jgi:uncharacterized protein
MFNITSEDIITRMRFDNPWWTDARKPLAIEKLPRRDYLVPFEQLAKQSTPRRSVVLLGPRRTGKTVMLFQLIRTLLNEGIKPQNIVYAALDTPIFARHSMTQLLELYLTNLAPDTTQTIYAIFDEVQYLKGWNQELKSLTDSHLHCKFLVTGSAAGAIRNQSQESGAGRFTDFILPPLTFAEFLRMTGHEDRLIKPHPAKQDAFITDAISELNAQFVKYLNYGGFPELALSPEMQASASRYVRNDILDKVLLRDLPSIYGISDTTELYSLFSMLAYNTGNEVSLEKLSQGAGVAKNTLKRYLEYLESAFLIRMVERVDKNARSFQRSSAFKVYLSNASLRAALFGALEPDDDKFGNVAETAVVGQWMHDPDFKRNLRYARWDEREVDLIYLNPALQNSAWAVEIKWSDRHVERPEDIKGLLEFAKANPQMISALATSKTMTTTIRTPQAIVNLEPTALYCYTVGKNILKNIKEDINIQPTLL